MSVIRLKQVEFSTGTYVPIETNCGYCKGCVPRVSALSLADLSQDEVTVELPGAVQLSMLWNSWMKPLLATVSAAIACDLLQLPELPSVIVVIVSFIAGCALCREQPADSLRILPGSSV